MLIVAVAESRQEQLKKNNKATTTTKTAATTDVLIYEKLTDTGDTVAARHIRHQVKGSDNGKEVVESNRAELFVSVFCGLVVDMAVSRTANTMLASVLFFKKQNTNLSGIATEFLKVNRSEKASVSVCVILFYLHYSVVISTGS